MDFDSSASPRDLSSLPEGTFEVTVARVWGRWMALLWSEWFAHSRLILGFLLAWLGMVWLLPLFTHPLWLLVLGPGFACVAAPAFGGADVIDGCEEFMMGFPPTRSDRYLARLAVSAIFLLILTIINLLALGLNLSDVLDRVFLNTGLLQAVQLRQTGFLYGLVAAIPFTVFACGFAIAALARTRMVAFSSWLWGAFVALGLLRMGFQMEEWRGGRLDGRYSLPLLVVASAWVLIVAWRLYMRKEAGSDAAPLRIPLSGWGWLFAIFVTALGVGILLSWFASNLSRIL